MKGVKEESGEKGTIDCKLRYNRKLFGKGAQKQGLPVTFDPTVVMQETEWRGAKAILIHFNARKLQPRCVYVRVTLAG